LALIWFQFVLGLRSSRKCGRHRLRPLPSARWENICTHSSFIIFQCKLLSLQPTAAARWFWSGWTEFNDRRSTFRGEVTFWLSSRAWRRDFFPTDSSTRPYGPKEEKVSKINTLIIISSKMASFYYFNDSQLKVL